MVAPWVVGAVRVHDRQAAYSPLTVEGFRLG
jgi:hypothetical protein